MSEKNCPIYCDSYNIGAVYDNGAAIRGTGTKEVAGTGGLDWEGAWEAEGGEHSAGMDTEEAG